MPEEKITPGEESILEYVEELADSVEELQNEVLAIDIETPLEAVYSQIETYKAQMDSFAEKVPERGLRGEKGEKGERGERGLRGPAGESKVGPRGPAGEKGDSGESKIVHDFGGGGNLPGRRWQVNGSIVGASFNDVNIVSPGATAANDVTGKRTTLTIPGGGTPAAPDTSLQYNNSGAFGGTKLLYTEPSATSTKLTASPVSGASDGRSITIQASDDSDGNHTGGDIILNPGNGDSNGKIYVNNTVTSDKTISFISKPGTAGNDGKTINFTTGHGGDSAAGGDMNFSTGNGGSTSGKGGDIQFDPGDGIEGDSDGGNINMAPGNGVGAGVNGAVKIFDPTSGIGAVLDTGNLSTTDKTFSYINNSGLIPITSHARADGAVAANTNILTRAVGADDGTFQLLANVLITTSTTFSIGVTVDYTDEGNTPRTLTIPVSQLAGTMIVAITNITGAGPYEGVALIIRAKAGTNIVFKTAGTFTSVQYNVDCTVVQVN